MSRSVARARTLRCFVGVLTTLVLVITSLPLHAVSLIAEIGPSPARSVGLAAGAENLNWTSQTSPADNGWLDLVWSSEVGIFVGVAGDGVGNRVMTSSDGVSWTVRPSAADHIWTSVTWSPELGLFAAIASINGTTTNRVMTSPDGTSWTLHNAPSGVDNLWNSVVWSPELGLFAAVRQDSGSNANTVMTSPDGVNWTLRTALASNWSGITWSPALRIFVAVASSGVPGLVMTSPDGMNWTSRAAANANQWSDVAWSPVLGIFVAVAGCCGSGNRVMTSPDGVTWTTRTSAANNTWTDIAWSPELRLFAAVSQSGLNNRVMTSPDGVTWTIESTPANNVWKAIAWSPDLEVFAAVAATGTGNRVMIGTGTQVRDFGSDKAYSFGMHTYGAFGADPVNLGTGSLTIHADDLSMPGRVLGFRFTRWYNSADRTIGPLGPGWTHSYYWTVADRGATAELRRGDGRRDTFTRQPDGSYVGPPGVFDTLTKSPDGEFNVTLSNQIFMKFSSGGVLLTIGEPAGNTIDLTYTGALLTAVADSVGRQIAFSYDARARLIQIQDASSRKVTFAYDTVGRLNTVTDGIGNGVGPASAHQWKYGYDGDTRHIRTITDPDGRVLVTNVYDPEGRVIEQRDGIGALTTIAYSPGQTIETDPRGHASTYAFDSRLRVLTRTDAVGPNTYTISYAYDAVGNRTAVTDRNVKTTDFTYDTRGNVLTKVDPSPDGLGPRPLTSFSYDAKNNLIQVVDAVGAVTELNHDPFTSSVLSVTRQIDAVLVAKTTYTYGDALNPGLVTRVVAPRGNIGPTPDLVFSTMLAYDVQGNLIRSTDADGAITTYAYDAVGRLVSFVDPDGNATPGLATLHTWKIAYDHNDRETSRTDPLGNVTRWSYDGRGNRTASIDRKGNVTNYAYDANARLSNVQQQPQPVTNAGLWYSTSVTRDANGNATRVTQPNGVATDYGYDSLNRLTMVTTHPSPTTSLVSSYALNGNGQPVARTTADGVTANYAYDALARLTSVTAPGVTIGYTYDALGRRTSMTDAIGLTTYQYDRLGRPTQVAGPGGTLGYLYDGDGNRTRLTYPGGDAVAYTYSPGGRLQTVSDWASRTSTYAYLPSGLVTTTAYPNAHTTKYTYDAAQRLTTIHTEGQQGLSILSQTYTLDGEGNRTQRTDAGLPGLADTTTAYDYDGLNRLLAAHRATTHLNEPLSSETFTYDAATNVATRTGPVAAYSYDGANRLTGDASQTYVFDNADRLTQRGSDVFGYDVLGRLTSAVVTGATITYASDGDGLLRSRTSAGQTTNYLWDTTVDVAALLGAGDERVVHGLGPMYRVAPDGTYRSLVRDALGSVRAEASELGLITATYDYHSYGEVRSGPLLATPSLLGYAGELRDPVTGLIYVRARWYDSTTGRFLTSDPVPGQPAIPVSLNQYAYANGNPALLTDPRGTCPMCWGAAFGLIGYTATAWLAGEEFDLTQAVIATTAGALSGGISAFIRPLALTGAGSLSVKTGLGAVIGSQAAIASGAAKRLRGDALTQTDIAQIPAGMLVGGLAAALPIPAGPIDYGAGFRGLAQGVFAGGASVAQEFLQRYLAERIAVSGAYGPGPDNK